MIEIIVGIFILWLFRNVGDDNCSNYYLIDKQDKYEKINHYEHLNDFSDFDN